MRSRPQRSHVTSWPSMAARERATASHVSPSAATHGSAIGFPLGGSPTGARPWSLSTDAASASGSAPLGAAHPTGGMSSSSSLVTPWHERLAREVRALPCGARGGGEEGAHARALPLAALLALDVAAHDDLALGEVAVHLERRALVDGPRRIERDRRGRDHVEALRVVPRERVDQPPRADLPHALGPVDCHHATSPAGVSILVTSSETVTPSLWYECSTLRPTLAQ